MESFSVHDLAMAIKSMLSQRESWEEIGEYNYLLGQRWNWKYVSDIYIHGYKKLFTEYYSIPSSANE